MSLQPQKLYRQASQGGYKVNKQGMQPYYKCPECQTNSTTRSFIVKHIAAKHNMASKETEFNMIQNFNDKFLQHEEKMDRQFRELNLAKQQCSIMKNQIKSLKEKVYIFQSRTHQNIETILKQIMNEEKTFISVLKISVYQQIGSLLQDEFEAHDIINKSKEIIIEHMKSIQLRPYFSQFKKDFTEFKDFMIQHHKKSSRKYQLRVIKCLDFLGKFSQKQFYHLQKMILHIVAQPNSKRIIIRRLYDLFRKRYSQKYSFPALPQRAFDYIAKSNPRPKLLFSNVISLMRLLKQKNDYTLMVDVWFCLSLGLRSRQLKRVYLEDQDGNIANYLKIWQTKNQNYTNRIVPDSLRAMISKHKITYPISQQRWKMVVSTCLNYLKSFYGLRALCITEIVGGVLGVANIKFHKDWINSLKYYINMENKKIINSVFAFEDYEISQSTKYFVFHEQSVEILEYTITKQEQHIIEGGEQIIMAMNLDSNSILEKDATEQQRIQHTALKQGFELSKQSFKNIHEIFNIEEKIGASQISEQLQIPINVYQIKPGREPVLVQQIITNSRHPVKIIKQNLSSGNNYKVDESTFLVSELAKRKRKRIGESTLPQNWPILKNSIKCIKCSGQLQQTLCSKNSHYYNRCHICKYQNHECSIERGEITSQRIYCQKYVQSASKFDVLKARSKRNNLSQILRKQNRTMIDRIKFLSSTPPFKTTMPKFSENVRKSIQYVRVNQQFLPLEIRHTQKKGYGVYSVQKILAGTLICLYNGVIVQNELIQNDDSRIFIGMIRKQNTISSLFLDASKHCNLGRFLNSSASANSLKRNCSITQGLIQRQNKCQIVLFLYSCKNIDINEELLWWYGDQYWKILGINPLQQELQQSNRNLKVNNPEENIELNLDKKSDEFDGEDDDDWLQIEQQYNERSVQNFQEQQDNKKIEQRRNQQNIATYLNHNKLSSPQKQKGQHKLEEGQIRHQKKIQVDGQCLEKQKDQSMNENIGSLLMKSDNDQNIKISQKNEENKAEQFAKDQQNIEQNNYLNKVKNNLEDENYLKSLNMKEKNIQQNQQLRHEIKQQVEVEQVLVTQIQNKQTEIKIKICQKRLQQYDDQQYAFNMPKTKRQKQYSMNIKFDGIQQLNQPRKKVKLTRKLIQDEMEQDSDKVFIKYDGVQMRLQQQLNKNKQDQGQNQLNQKQVIQEVHRNNALNLGLQLGKMKQNQKLIQHVSISEINETMIKQQVLLRQMKLDYHQLQNQSEIVKQLSIKIEQQLAKKQQDQNKRSLENKKQNINLTLKNQKGIKAYGIYYKDNLITNNSKLRLEIASIVKLLVVKVILDLAESDEEILNLNIILQKYAHMGTTAWLIPGKTYSVTQLIEATLISSACEASYNLALYFGKLKSHISQSIKAIEFFQSLMQKEAEKLKMVDTTIEDVTGLGHTKSTVTDLRNLIQWTMKNSFICKILETSSTFIQKNINNTNALIPLKIYGKTGTGERALFCFAGFKDEYILILLGALQTQLIGNKIQTLIKKLKTQIKKLK